MYIDFDKLPPSSRIWIFQSAAHLEVEEVELLSARLYNFLSDWQAHGKDLQASFQVLYSRFLVVCIDEASYQATGCSIDKLMQLVQGLEQSMKISLLDRMQITYREENGMIHSLPLHAFRLELENGELHENTIVFNNLIEKKAQLESEWEVPVKDSWHRQMLPIG